jgi:antitoxin component YwqK of YwqJK toxin-antitoxin module
MSNDSELKRLLHECKRYVNDEMYVYISCKNFPMTEKNVLKKWLIILKKVEDTLTNESRENIKDTKNALYRANKLKVIKIINVVNPNVTKRKMTHKHDIIKTKYEVNKMIESKSYTSDINIVLGDGIYYFKTPITAYYKIYLDDTIALSTLPHISVQKSIKSCNWINWYNNGQVCEEGLFKDGYKTGKWIEYYKSGNIASTLNYRFGEKTGQYTKYYENKQKEEEGEYDGNEKTKLWIRWYDNGEKTYEGNFKNGKKTGQWTEWFSNGNKFSEGFYKRGIKIGVWHFWSVCGTREIQDTYDDNGKIIKCE